jgi:4'-phosphopantetheinyl transferase
MPLTSLALSKHEVHAWLIDVDVDDSVISGLEALLSCDEHTRGMKFRFQADRRRHFVSHGALRQVLSLYLGIAPQKLKFTHGRYGKPCLQGEQAQSGLSFNLSHSAGKALLGLTREREIGVDIEFIQQSFDWEQLAQRFFALQEVEMLRSVPQESRNRAFFACWTRKEAYLKAKGLGLNLPLKRFSVSLAPGEPAALLRHETEPAEVKRWSLEEVRVGPEYAAAIAVEGHGWELKSWTWRDGLGTRSS